MSFVELNEECLAHTAFDCFLKAPPHFILHQRLLIHTGNEFSKPVVL